MIAKLIKFMLLIAAIAILLPLLFGGCAVTYEREFGPGPEGQPPKRTITAKLQPTYKDYKTIQRIF